jgi:hypothetical protein
VATRCAARLGSDFICCHMLSPLEYVAFTKSPRSRMQGLPTQLLLTAQSGGYYFSPPTTATTVLFSRMKRWNVDETPSRLGPVRSDELDREKVHVFSILGIRGCLENVSCFDYRLLIPDS